MSLGPDDQERLLEALQEIDMLRTLCAEAYQVIGTLATEAGRPDNDQGVVKILDNLSEHRLVHTDVLPFPASQPPKAGTGETP